MINTAKEFLIFFFIYVWIALLMISASLSTSTNQQLNESINLILLILAIISTFGFALVYGYKPSKNVQTEAAIYSAYAAYEELKVGDRIKSSIAFGKLLSILSQMMDYEIPFLGKKFFLKNYLFTDFKRINKKTVYRYLQTENNIDECLIELDGLVKNLKSSKEPDYTTVQHFLGFFELKTGDLTKGRVDYTKVAIEIITLFLAIFSAIVKFT